MSTLKHQQTLTLAGPEAEPELAQNSIEFVSRLLNKSPGTFIGMQPPDAAEFFFLFTLQVLDGREPLLKAASAEFWVRHTVPHTLSEGRG